jgi:myo-inositol 2-dehydrogenase / D-chiro-inositol 1-dehydrogenase
LMGVFRLGLIGAGRMGRTHLRALAASEYVRVTAVAEPAETSRREIGAGYRIYAEAGAMLDAGGIDGVLIAAPTGLHRELIERAAARGLPVLCEKPAGVVPGEAQAAGAAAQAAGVLLQIGFWRRFVPALLRLRQRIAQGDFGGVYLLACYQWDKSLPTAQFRAQSGGIFVDMGVHEFDQLRWLTGQDITETHAVATSIVSTLEVSGDSESGQVLCRLSGGGTGFVSLGRRYPAGDVCWVQVFGTDNAEECRFLWPPDGEAAFLHALRLQAESFARSASGAVSEGAEAADAVAALVAAEAASRALGGEAGERNDGCTRH